jgi:hypothetical protein
MSANNSEVPDVDHDQIVEQALELSARFPEVHQISDCISTVRQVAGLFGKIIRPDGHNDGANAELDPSSLAQDPTYSLTDADKISKKLRRLARSRGTQPVLTTLQLLDRLWPEIKAALDDGYYPQLADVLSDYGVDVSALSQPSEPVGREPR